MINDTKERTGITMVSLVVTIILLILLAGVSINIVVGEKGIITIAKKAKENMEIARIEEQENINELYSQMIDETNDSSLITISIEDLNNIIDERIEEKMNSLPDITTLIEEKITEKTKIGNNHATFSFDSNLTAIGTTSTDLRLRALNGNEICEQSNNSIKIKKSGYYLITGTSSSTHTGGDHSQFVEIKSSQQGKLANTSMYGREGLFNAAGDITVCRHFNQGEIITASGHCSTGSARLYYEGTITLISEE